MSVLSTWIVRNIRQKQNKTKQNKTKQQPTIRIDHVDLKEMTPIPLIPKALQDQGSLKVVQLLTKLQSNLLFIAASCCPDLLSMLLEDLELRLFQGELDASHLGLQYFEALEIAVFFEHLPGVNVILSRGIIEKTDQFESEMQKLIETISKMNRKAMHDLFSKFLQNPQKIVEEVRRDLGKYSLSIINSQKTMLTLNRP